MDILETLIKLCDIDGISGYEKNASTIAKSLLEPLVDECYIDKFGSVIGKKQCQNPNAKTIMLDAHIDQIGFVVSDITKDGFIKFHQVGGVDPRMLLSLDVFVLGKEKLRGVVSCKPPHLVTDFKKAVPISEMAIDIGMTRERGLEFIKIGDPIIFAESVYSISKDSVTGKCLDDRAGVMSILHALEQLKDKELDVNILVVFSGTEETGGLGSTIATYDLRPDFAIAVDVTHGKTPDAPPPRTCEMGKIYIGKGPNLHKKLTDNLIKTAKAYDIPFGLEVMEGATGTNAWHIQVSREGIPVSLISFPLKYMHTPIETIKIADLKNTGNLIYRFIKDFRGDLND